MPYPNALIQSAPRNNLLAAQMLPATGEGSYLRQQFPQVYGFLGGLAGTAPDEMQGSAMDPNTAAVRQGASYGYLPGLVASSVPLGKVGAGMGMLAGMARGTQKFDNSALMAGKALAKIDQITGLPLNTDGTVTLFHHTNKNAAQSIQKTGVLKSAGEPSVYLTTERTPTTGYGDTVVPVKVNPSKLNLDDEFPNGRLDFSIDVGKPGGFVKVAPVPSFVAPQDEALRLAQQRASLPPAQGGLGLPAGNTPEQRAAAMGGKEMTHFSRHGGDFSVLDSGQYAQAPFDAIGTHVGSKEAALERFRNTTGTTDQIKGVTYPVNMLGKNPLMNPEGHAWAEDELSAFLRKEGGHNVQGNLTYPQMNAALRKKLFEDQGYTSIPYVNEVENKGVISHIVPPENLRSRFAAFDPWRKTAAIAATMGVAAPDLLAGQAPQQAPKFDNSALMK